MLQTCIASMVQVHSTPFNIHSLLLPSTYYNSSSQVKLSCDDGCHVHVSVRLWQWLWSSTCHGAW